MSDKKVCFIFGAGAEDIYDISTGDKFAEEIIRIQGRVGTVENAIKSHYRKWLSFTPCNKNGWYPDYHASSFELDSLLKASIAKRMHEENVVVSTKNEFEALVDDAASSYKSNEEKEKTIFRRPNYMGILDENFHTLISPKTLGPHKFWRVIATYTAAYLKICTDILMNGEEAAKKEDYLRLLKYPCATYKEIENKISREYDEVKSYYKVLRNYAGKLNVGIITTNYTPICEIILNGKAVKSTKQADCSNSANIAYIHGRLNWFECPYTLQVYDTKCNNDRDAFENYLLFPYIFIQSGVKPIVERKQLEEYCKAIKLLDAADEIAILGYSLNVDDNHLNSLLHSYAVRNKKRITYFAYADRKMDEQVIKERLRVPQKKKAHLNIIHINKDNCTEKFEAYLTSFDRQ